MAERCRNAWLTVLLAGIVLAPHAAEACSVCSAGRDDETRLAFLLTTVFLSVLPLLLVGGLVFFLRRRARQLAAQQEPPAPGLAAEL